MEEVWFVPPSMTGQSTDNEFSSFTTDTTKEQSHLKPASPSYLTSSEVTSNFSYPTVQGDKPCLKVAPTSCSTSDVDSEDQGYVVMGFPEGVVTQLSKVSVGDDVKFQESHVASNSKEMSISPQEVKLLQCESVMFDMLSELMKNEVVVDTSRISARKIIVKIGDIETVLRVLNSVILSVSLEADEFDEEVLESMETLKTRFCQQFDFTFNKRSNAFIIKIHRRIQLHVLPEINQLRMISITFPVSTYVMIYLRRYWTVAFHSLQSSVKGIVEITRRDDIDSILMTCERKSLTVARRAVEEMLQNVTCTQTEIDPVKALYLQGIRGKIRVRAVKKKYQCRVYVKSPEQRLLMHLTVPGGKELLVYEGDMARADCQVLVLPLCQGQSEWSDSEKHILERGYLTSDIGRYTAKTTPVQKQLTKVLRCQELGEGQIVVVMYISGVEVARRIGLLLEACKETLKVASSMATSIAFPVKLSKEISVDISLQILISAIRDHWAEGPAFLNVLLYFDSVSELLRKEITNRLAEGLPPHKSRVTEFACEDSTDPYYNVVSPSEKPMLYLCGKKDDMKNALKEITDMSVPEEYALRDQAFRDRHTVSDTEGAPGSRTKPIPKQPNVISDEGRNLDEACGGLQIFQAKVTILPTIAAMRNNISGDYILSVAYTSLQLLDHTGTNCVRQWPYSYIRRFGHTNCVFRMEVGRKSSTGEGDFAFLTPECERLVSAINDECRKLALQ